MGKPRLGIELDPELNVQKLQKESIKLTETLTKAIEKNKNNKDAFGLIQSTKTAIREAQKLDKALLDVTSREYKPKFAKQMGKVEQSLSDVRGELAKVDDEMYKLANADYISARNESYRNIERLETEIQKAHTNWDKQEKEKIKLQQGWEDRKQRAIPYKEQIEEADKFIRKHKALIDSGVRTPEIKAMLKMRENAQLKLQSLGLDENEYKQAGANIDTVINRNIENIKELEKELEKAKKDFDDLVAKRPTSAIASPEVQSTAKYQALQSQKTSLTAQEQQYASEYESLKQQESQAEAEFAQSVLDAQDKIAQGYDKTNGTMTVQAVKFQEMGGKMATAMQVVMPVLNTLQNTTRKVLNLIPSTIGRITNAIHKLTSIIHLPKISAGIKDIFRQLKRSTGIIAGVILGARGLQSILNKVRSSVLAGFKDIYNQDKQFKTQIDTIKQKVLDIQVAFAETLMPVIQMALPYVKQLLDWVMSLLGVLQRFISTITGIQAYTKAIKGLGGAAQSASKQLSKFDELNNLSSGGGGGLTPDAGSIGDPKKIEDWFKFTRNIIDKIEEMLRGIPWEEVYAKARKFGQTVGQILLAIFKPSFWNAVGETLAGVFNTILYFFNALGHTEGLFDNIGKSIFQFFTGILDKFKPELLMDTLLTWADGFWTILKTVLTERNEGQTLAERIVDMLTSSLSQVSWTDIYNKVTEVADTLSETLNQLIDPNLAKQIGRTLGGTLMSIVTFAVEFFGEGGVDWENLGTTVAEGINGVFEQIDGGKLAKGISAIAQAITTTIGTIIKEVEWSAVAEDIKSLLTNLDWKSVLTVLIPAIAPTLFSILWDVVKLVWALVKKPLLNFLKTTVWPEVQAFFETIFANPAGLATTVGNFVTTLGEILIAALGGYQIGNGIGEIFSLLMGDFESAEAYEGASIPALIIKMLGLDWDSSRWDEVWSDTFDAIGLDKFVLWIEDLPETLANNVKTNLEILKSIGEAIFEGIIAGIDLATGDFSAGDVLSVFTAIFNAICNIFGIHSPSTEMYSVGENIILGILEGFNLVDFIGKMTEWWNTNVLPWFTLEKWTALATNIKTSIVNVWTETKDFWSTSITEWWGNSVAPWFTLAKWTELLKPIPDAFSTAFKGAANAAVVALNKIIEAVEKLINEGAVSGLNKLIEGANYIPGVDIPTINAHVTLPKIPALASGTVIPPSMNEFIAKLGDNNRETEIVSPLSTMKQAMIEAMQEVGMSGGASGDINIELTVDGKTLARTVVRQNDIYKKQTGRSLFAT